MRQAATKTTNKGKYLLGLIFVVLVWGTSPLFTKGFVYRYYEPGFVALFDTAVAAVAMGVIAIPRMKHFNKQYLWALVTGFFYSAACIAQKFALKQTTPGIYAFLENLSCIVVPFLLWALTAKRPSFMKILSCVICLVSSFVISGGFSGGSMNTGVILCAVAGIFYGVNIAGTAFFAQKLDTSLYLCLQFFENFVITSIYVLFFDHFSFTPHYGALAGMVFQMLFSSVFCWCLRTTCLKHLDAVTVAVVMPMSAVVTTVFSVIFGMDTVSLSLVLGAGLGLLSIAVSEIADHMEDKKKNSRLEKEETAVSENS